jgi:hypothetical protein
MGFVTIAHKIEGLEGSHTPIETGRTLRATIALQQEIKEQSIKQHTSTAQTDHKTDHKPTTNLPQTLQKP